MSRCCICKREVNADEAPILMMSAYGLPRYICPKCEADIDIAQESNDPEKIADSCKSLGESLTSGNTDDMAVIDAVNDIICAAGERSEAIKNGSYDFSSKKSSSDADEEFELTEDMLETEEDRQKDEREAKISKIADTVISWASGIILLAAVIFFIVKFVI